MAGITVAFPFKDQKTWTGGLHYVRNLVSALALLPGESRPKVVVIDDDPAGLEDLRRETGYPDLHRVLAPPRRKGRVGAVRALFERPPRCDPPVDVVLMGSVRGLEHRSVQWIPDFQEERLPRFFAPSEIEARRRRYAKALAIHRHVMVSSEDVRRDLERFYGRYGNRIHVVRFASFADTERGDESIVALRERYRLPPRFFLCSNQVWRHKNHEVVLRALADASAPAFRPTIAFTGREHDYRDEAYPRSVKALASQLRVTENARFLGFIPRADQLGLMSACIAVIQPSLCEGWSTTVEDAKALGKHVLASDLAVHREQLSQNADFFPPDDDRALAALLQRYAEADPVIGPHDHERAKRDFAQSLLAMISDVAQDPGGSPAERRRRRMARVTAAFRKG